MQNAIWGADSKSLYFSGSPENAKSKIWRANADGSGAEVLVEGCGFILSDASPDGQYLLAVGRSKGIYASRKSVSTHGSVAKSTNVLINQVSKSTSSVKALSTTR